MADFDQLLPPAEQRRLAEYEELVALTFQSAGPPHHILSFCHNCIGGEPPRAVAEEFGRPGGEWPLHAIAQAFLERYAGDAIDRRHLHRLMGPLWARLKLTLDRATAADTNWRSSNAHTLELYGRQICGETTLGAYDSGKLPSRVAAWNLRATALIRSRKAVTEREVLSTLLSGAISPCEVVAYFMRSIFKDSYRDIVQRSSAPLRRLAEEVQARFAALSAAGAAAAADDFAQLRGTLDQPLERFAQPSPADFQRRYQYLLDRVLGDILLKEFETSHLPSDIADWTNSIRKSVQNRYLARRPR